MTKEPDMFTTGEALREVIIRTGRSRSAEWIRLTCDSDPSIHRLITYTGSGLRLIPREAVDLLTRKVELGRR